MDTIPHITDDFSADDAPDDELKSLRRSVREYRERVDKLEFERDRFLDHIADLRVRHDRVCVAFEATISDLHQMIAQLRPSSAAGFDA